MTSVQYDRNHGEPVRDLTFVTDTAAAFIGAASSDEAVGQTVNAGYGKGIAIADLATRILTLMRRERTHRIVSDAERVRPENSEVFDTERERYLPGAVETRR